ncbi:uncharacterized protein BO87DRAFT_386967 [Aspergillus neoniger CBS 115656]|uniref:Uncharacterized protein n=1 Tax=Aspergillus neoniger (strain CBS 115656) TaxID=1448310 RepID=A0A318YIR0_ASPNB|nr:hypothetical protein BO87DRAFT_386967 [Aspergillus neoniger CBS 115656]PYH33994.1 hypothetical protein BO87DRAFT_386967 [Aspergillus neoniger CBS 115656]
MSVAGSTSSTAIVEPSPEISHNLWYRLHVLIFDLNNFSNTSSRKRLESVIDPSFIGKPYFTDEEAEKIKSTVINSTGGTFSQALEEGLNERLERRNKKRVESGDYRVCAAHDLAPLMARALGVDLKQMAKDKEFAGLIEKKGLNLQGEIWGEADSRCR